MTLMPAFLPRDSALLTRDLALQAAHLFENAQQAGADEVSLQNIYRLLEMYRFDAFIGFSPRGILEVRDIKRRSEVNAAEGQVLKHALDAAKNSVFPNVDKQTVVQRLEQLITVLANRAAADAAELQRARRFFEEVATALRPA